jgi:hypothetical protein
MTFEHKPILLNIFLISIFFNKLIGFLIVFQRDIEI